MGAPCAPQHDRGGRGGEHSQVQALPPHLLWEWVTDPGHLLPSRHHSSHLGAIRAAAILTPDVTVEETEAKEVILKLSMGPVLEVHSLNVHLHVRVQI